MTTIRRIFIILIVAGLIGAEAALVIKATDPGTAAGQTNQVNVPASNGKALNREQTSPAASNPAQTGVKPISVNVTLENLFKTTLIVLGVWLIERLVKNKRRKKLVPVRKWARIDHPEFDLLSRWMDKNLPEADRR